MSTTAAIAFALHPGDPLCKAAVQIEVYPTDADAADAAASLMAEHVRAAATARGHATVVLGAGRSGRAVMVALAGRGDLPWGKIEWFLADERLGRAGDPLAHATVARDSLFGPRGVPAARVHGPRIEPDPERVAIEYAASLSEVLGAAGAIDVVVLGIGTDGALGALAPDCAALDAPGWVAVVPPGAPGEPARVSVTPALLARARHVIVTSVGPDTAEAVSTALREARGPAACVLPSERVTWVVDRAAATPLLKDAATVDDRVR